MPSKHGSTDGHAFVLDSYVAQFAAGDYVEVWWHTNNTTVSLYTAAAVAPVPQIPSVTVEVTFAAKIPE